MYKVSCINKKVDLGSTFMLTRTVEMHLNASEF